jgi:hypothetical protein
MNNVNENRIEILRKNLSVYEAEGIQCQLTLQKKTIVLNVKLLIFIVFYIIFFLFLVSTM